MNEKLERLNNLRRRFLLVLYEMTDGSTSRGVEACSIGAALGLDQNETEAVAQWLVDRGRARWYSMGGNIAVTAAGVDEAEVALAAGDSGEVDAVAASSAHPAAQQADAPGFDLFVSYASEDASFVSALTEELRQGGLRVWLDQLEMRVGDSLREKIDHGLARSRFGAIVFSPAYLAKLWTRAELNALVHRQITSGEVVILPIRLNLTPAQVAAEVPLLADRVSLDAADGVSLIAAALEDRVKGTSTEPHPERQPTASRRLDAALVRNLALPNSYAPPIESGERALTARAVLAGRVPKTPEPVLGDKEMNLILDLVAESALERLMIALTTNGGHVHHEHHWHPALPRTARILTLARPAAPVRMYPEFSARGQASVTLRPVVGGGAGGWLAMALDVVLTPSPEIDHSGTPLSLDDLHALVYCPISAALEVGTRLLEALNDGRVAILGVGYTLIPNGGGLDCYAKLGSSASGRIPGAPDPTAIHWAALSLDEIESSEQRLETTRHLITEFFIDGAYTGYEHAVAQLTERLE